jgi:hypothetical protein
MGLHGLEQGYLYLLYFYFFCSLSLFFSLPPNALYFLNLNHIFVFQYALKTTYYKCVCVILRIDSEYFPKQH